MSLKIYFCGSIRAGRQDADLYARLIKLLQGYGTVLTEHVGSLKLEEEEGRKKPVLRLRACLQRRHFCFCSVFFLFFFFNILILYENICCGYPIEVHHRGPSDEYPQHMFSLRNKKNIIWSSVNNIASDKALFCRKVYRFIPHAFKICWGVQVFIGSVHPFICPSVNICNNQNFFELFLLRLSLQPHIRKYSYLVWGYLGGFSSILHLHVWFLGSFHRAGLEVKI